MSITWRGSPRRATMTNPDHNQVVLGHLASSASGTCDAWSRGCGFKPHAGDRDYLNKNLKPHFKLKNKTKQNQMPSATGFWLNCNKPITSLWRQALRNPVSSRLSLPLCWFTSSFTSLCKVWSPSSMSFNPSRLAHVFHTHSCYREWGHYSSVCSTRRELFCYLDLWPATSLVLTLSSYSLGSLFHLQIFVPSFGHTAYF